MKRVASISVILEDPINTSNEFNQIISNFQKIVIGRMGIPFHKEGISVVSIIVLATLDEINSLTGKLGNIKNTSVKTSISKKEIVE